MRRGYAETDIGQIHYREMGTGDAVLLFHQTASSSVHFGRVMPLLADRGYRGIAMDTPGFGMSDPPPGPPQNMGHYARAALGVLDHLRVERANVAGMRTGASIAIELAASRPDRVDKLVLTGLLAMDNDEERHQWLTEGPVKRWNPDGAGHFIDSHIRNWVRYFARENDAELYLVELIAALQAGPNFWWAYEAVVKFDAYRRLEAVECPILFLNPIGDPQYDTMRRGYERAPGALYREMPGPAADTAGWVGVLTQYQREYVDAVADFLRA
jgi:pimeloyl-ACP methyl ester carboxylesterase